MRKLQMVLQTLQDHFFVRKKSSESQEAAFGYDIFFNKCHSYVYAPIDVVSICLTNEKTHRIIKARWITTISLYKESAKTGLFSASSGCFLRILRHKRGISTHSVLQKWAT